MNSVAFVFKIELHLQRKSHGWGTDERDSEEGKEGSEMCVEKGEKREENDVWEYGRERINVQGRNLGMEGTRGGRDSARGMWWEWKWKIERQSLRTKWMKGKSAGYWRNAGAKRKETRRRTREGSNTRGTDMPVKKRAKGRWINVELSERDKDTDKQERRARIKESR
jgi:hypothetical protein